MELGTFGAIIQFGLALEARTAEFYDQAGHGEARAVLEELFRASRGRIRQLETARRELISEMILEPITGLKSDAYHIQLDPLADDAEVLRQASVLEATVARFYLDAAAKMPIREVVRLFKQFAQGREQQQELIAHVLAR